MPTKTIAQLNAAASAEATDELEIDRPGTPRQSLKVTAAQLAVLARAGLQAGDNITLTLNGDDTLTIAAPLPETVINVRAYGATGNGTTDDSAAFAAACAVAESAGRGIVYVPAGVYRVANVTLASNVALVGGGYGVTILQLPDGSAAGAHVVQSKDFAALTGTGSAASPYNIQVRSLTIDGNKAQNPDGGHGIAMYAYGYALHNIRVRNCAGRGLHSEWAAAGQPPNDGMESLISDFKIHNCAQEGVWLKGPHDTQFVNGIVYQNGPGPGTGAAAIRMPEDGYANGSVFAVVHVWGGTYDYCVYNASSSVRFDDCQLEGGAVAQVYEAASINELNNCKLFAGGVYETVTKAVIIASGVSNIKITGVKVENCGGGVVELVSGHGGDHRLEIQAQYYDGFAAPSPAILGSVDNHTSVNLVVINDAGLSTSDSLLRFPQRIQAVNGLYANLTVTNSFYAPSVQVVAALRASEYAMGWAIPASLTTYSGNVALLADLALATEVRFTVARVGEGPSGSTVGVVYWDTTLEDYAWLATGIDVSAGPSYGTRDSGWLPIAAGAQFDGTILLLAGSGGDGATEAYIGNVYVYWR